MKNFTWEEKNFAEIAAKAAMKPAVTAHAYPLLSLSLLPISLSLPPTILITSAIYQNICWFYHEEGGLNRCLTAAQLSRTRDKTVFLFYELKKSNKILSIGNNDIN